MEEKIIANEEEVFKLRQIYIKYPDGTIKLANLEAMGIFDPDLEWEEK